MSSCVDLFNDLIQFINALKLFMGLYFIVHMSTIALVAMGYTANSAPSPKPSSTEPEEDIVARIKANTVKLHPELYNVAVLAKRTAHGEQNEFDVWAAAISAFERPFNQSVLEYGQSTGSPSRRAALEALDEEIQGDLRASERSSGLLSSF